MRKIKLVVASLIIAFIGVFGYTIFTLIMWKKDKLDKPKTWNIQFAIILVITIIFTVITISAWKEQKIIFYIYLCITILNVINTIWKLIEIIRINRIRAFLRGDTHKKRNNKIRNKKK